MPHQEGSIATVLNGSVPMTPAQASYLQSLSKRASVDFKPTLSKAEASRQIDFLRSRLQS